MISWLTTTSFGRFVSTFFISMIPIVELRGGLPYGIGLGLSLPAALAASILANMFPVPFILFYIRQIFSWMRKHWRKLDGMITHLESRADEKGDAVRKYGTWGLLLLVAIPLPGTGAWTGALVAALLNLPSRRSVPVIFCGVCIAALVVAGITLGVIHAF